jgi:hypothetical protein
MTLAMIDPMNGQTYCRTKMESVTMILLFAIVLLTNGFRKLDYVLAGGFVVEDWEDVVGRRVEAAGGRSSVVPPGSKTGRGGRYKIGVSECSACLDVRRWLAV